MEKTIHFLIMYTMLVLSLFLFYKGRKHPASLMLGIYALVEVLTNGINSINLAAGGGFFYHHPYTHFIWKPLYCLWVPLFYLYFRHELSSEFRLARKHLIHFLPFIAFLLFFLGIWIFKGNIFIRDQLYIENSMVYNSVLAIDVTVKLQYLIYNVLMIGSLLKFEKSYRDQSKRNFAAQLNFNWLRFIAYGYAFACLTNTIAFFARQQDMVGADTINLISISYFFLFFFIIFFNTITRKTFDFGFQAKSNLLSDSELSSLMEKIDHSMEKKALYLHPELNLQKIAAALNEKDRQVSMAINSIKKRNIKDYINYFRVVHACRLLQTDKNKPVFEIMYESGFNTKGAFYLAFKKMTGKTPSQYRDDAFKTEAND